MPSNPLVRSPARCVAVSMRFALCRESMQCIILRGKLGGMFGFHEGFDVLEWQWPNVSWGLGREEGFAWEQCS